MCHVLVRLQFGFVIIPLNQKEVNAHKGNTKPSRQEGYKSLTAEY